MKPAPFEKSAKDKKADKKDSKTDSAKDKSGGKHGKGMPAKPFMKKSARGR